MTAGVFVSAVRADILERVRRYSFLMTMLAAVWLGYLVYDGDITLTLDEYRGVPNSAWIGTLVAISSAFFVPLVGFYIVKNSVTRDRVTRVGQILAGTPMGTVTYLSAKASSNFLVLGAIVAVQLIAAVLMQLLGPDRGPIEFGELVTPILLITLPPIAVVSALAVLFESVRWLSAGIGNIVFFFLFTMMMSIPIANGVRELDLVGVGEVEESTNAGARAAYPEFAGGFQLQAAPKSLMEGAPAPKYFTWDGIDWTPDRLLRRLWWFGGAFLLTLLAVPFFDRFDEAPAAPGRRRRGPGAAAAPVNGNGTGGGNAPASVAAERPSGLGERIGRVISSLAGAGSSSRQGRLVAAEVRLTLKGVHTAWYLAAAGLAVACLLSPADAVKHYILPFAWIWPALLWSKMGMREAWFGTGQLIFSAPRIRTAQLLAVWGSGVVISALTGSGAHVNFAAGGDWNAVIGVVAGMLFVPSLALACGVWTGGSKFFEALYVTLWYIGPMNNVRDLDFTGGSSTPGLAAAYVALSALLFIAADAGRRRQMAG